MQPVARKDVNRLVRYLDDLVRSSPKQSLELELSKVAKLLDAIGFEGPTNKSGVVRGFSHILLKPNPMLTDGQITVHILHGRRIEVITYRDFKRYLFPFIEEVLKELHDKKMIQEDANV
jgi:hypothetical protein